MTVQRAVLDAALEIIAADGPDLVSMREVARRAEVSHQAPYHHFGDRSGIFAAISAEGFSTLMEEFRKVIATGPGSARRCFEAYVTFALEHPAHFRVMFRSDLCGIKTHEATRIAADEAFNELMKMVEHTIGRPSDDQESFTWATLLWSTAHGLSTLILDGPLLAKLPTGASLESVISDVVDLMSGMVERQASRMGLLPNA
ncbi:MAG: TetR/AcrR family transcriptional regulator [Actinomycetota bacterium]